jgi:hypothetical protein
MNELRKLFYSPALQNLEKKMNELEPKQKSGAYDRYHAAILAASFMCLYIKAVDQDLIDSEMRNVNLQIERTRLTGPVHRPTVGGKSPRTFPQGEIREDDESIMSTSQMNLINPGHVDDDSLLENEGDEGAEPEGDEEDE